MKMRLAIGAGLTCAFILRAASGVLCALGPGASSYNPALDQRPTSDAVQLANRVNAAAKTVCKTTCPTIALFRNTTAANLMLMAAGDQGKLVYAPQFLGAVSGSFGDAGVIALIAHAFGHALDDSLGAAWIQSGWSAEQRADAWGGCTLARAGLSVSDTQAALRALEKYPPTPTPNWSVRIPAIRAGYAACGGDATKLNRK